MGKDNGKCALVLVRKPFGRKQALARVLAAGFGLDVEWALRVVVAAPIVVLENLAADQARRVLDALTGNRETARYFEIQFGPDAAMRKVEWAAPPRIGGEDLSAFISEVAAEADTTAAAPAIRGATHLVNITPKAKSTRRGEPRP